MAGGGNWDPQGVTAGGAGWDPQGVTAGGGSWDPQGVTAGGVRLGPPGSDGGRGAAGTPRERRWGEAAWAPTAPGVGLAPWQGERGSSVGTLPWGHRGRVAWGRSQMGRGDGTRTVGSPGSPRAGLEGISLCTPLPRNRMLWDASRGWGLRTLERRGWP